MKTVFALFFNALMGIVLSACIGIEPAYGAAGGVVMGAVMSAVVPDGVACVGLYAELWTGELLKRLRTGNMAPWYDRIPDASAMVKADVIHLVDVGGEVDVLINNTTYPIPVQDFQDGDIPIGLDKFQTKATRISDDEAHNLSYDKIGAYTSEHGEAIKIAKYKKAAHALAPYCKSDKTPVIQTSGTAVNGYKAITRKDIIALKDAFDKLEIPEDGRILVLCTDHYNQLIQDEQKFPDQFYSYTTGKLINMYGFEIYTFVNCPYYSNAGVKKGLKDAVASTDRKASFSFYLNRTFKADGSLKFYIDYSENNPTTQTTLFNFRTYNICMPKKIEAIGAIYSYDGSTVQSTNLTTPAGKRWSEVRDGLSVATASLEFESAGGEKTVEVITGKDFTFEDVDGYTITRDGNILTVKADANASTTADVTGTLTLTSTVDASKTATVSLKTIKSA